MNLDALADDDEEQGLPDVQEAVADALHVADDEERGDVVLHVAADAQVDHDLVEVLLVHAVQFVLHAADGQGPGQVGLVQDGEDIAHGLVDFQEAVLVVEILQEPGAGQVAHLLGDVHAVVADALEVDGDDVHGAQVLHLLRGELGLVQGREALVLDDVLQVVDVVVLAEDLVVGRRRGGEQELEGRLDLVLDLQDQEAEILIQPFEMFEHR